MAAAHEDPNNVFGPAGDTIPALQQRGVVFMACHNAIWEQTAAADERCRLDELALKN
jgi:hypothetical protein